MKVFCHVFNTFLLFSFSPPGYAYHRSMMDMAYELEIWEIDYGVIKF